MINNIKLCRVDFRLIHGQVINKWIKTISATKIIIINDELKYDDFLKDIYIMSAPPGVEVEILKVEEAVTKFTKEGLLYQPTLILFKNVNDAYRCYLSGFNFPHLQIGGLGSAPGRKIVYGPITLDRFDFEKLIELENSGLDISFHQVPEESSASFSKLKEKINFG